MNLAQTDTSLVEPCYPPQHSGFFCASFRHFSSERTVSQITSPIRAGGRDQIWSLTDSTIQRHDFGLGRRQPVARR